VPLALQLLGVVVGVGQQRRDVEHDLAVPEDVVHSLFARLSELGVQPAAVPARKHPKTEILERDKSIKSKSSSIEAAAIYLFIFMPCLLGDKAWADINLAPKSANLSKPTEEVRKREKGVSRTQMRKAAWAVINPLSDHFPLLAAALVRK